METRDNQDVLDPGPSRQNQGQRLRQRSTSPKKIRPGFSTSNTSISITSVKSTASGSSALVRTPSDSSIPSRPRPMLRVPDNNSSRTGEKEIHTSLSHLDLPVHLHLDPQLAHELAVEDARAEEGQGARKRRVETYSSLPPSPRLEGVLDFDMPAPKTSIGLGGREIEQALEGLALETGRSTSWSSAKGLKSNGTERTDSDEDEDGFDENGLGHGGSSGQHVQRIPRIDLRQPGSSPHPGGLDGEEGEMEHDVFWPARSRRPTNEVGAMAYDPSSLPNGDGEQKSKGKRREEDIPEQPQPFDGSESEEEKTSKGPQSALPSLWDLLKDDMGDEVWEGWVVDGKWCVYPSACLVQLFDPILTAGNG